MNVMGILLVVGLVVSAISFAMQPDDNKMDDTFQLLDKLMDKAQEREDKRNQDK